MIPRMKSPSLVQQPQAWLPGQLQDDPAGAAAIAAPRVRLGIRRAGALGELHQVFVADLPGQPGRQGRQGRQWPAFFFEDMNNNLRANLIPCLQY